MKTLLVSLFLLFSFSSFAQQEVWHEGYVTSTGSYVPGHWQTAPDATINNNWSTYPNVNPHTGKVGTIQPESEDGALFNVNSQAVYNLPDYNTKTDYSYLLPDFNVSRIVNDEYHIDEKILTETHEQGQSHIEYEKVHIFDTGLNVTPTKPSQSFYSYSNHSVNTSSSIPYNPKNLPSEDGFLVPFVIGSALTIFLLLVIIGVNKSR